METLEINSLYNADSDMNRFMCKLLVWTQETRHNTGRSVCAHTALSRHLTEDLSFGYLIMNNIIFFQPRSETKSLVFQAPRTELK